MTDEELLLRYRDTGDVDALGELFTRLQGPMVRFVLGYLSDKHLAEDAVNEAFIRLMAKCKQFDAARRVRPWFVSMVRNVAIDMLRKRKARPVLVEMGPRMWILPAPEREPPAILEEAEQRQLIMKAVRDAISRLSYAMRTVVLLRLQGLKFREVAEQLQINPTTARTRMNTAVRRLREALVTT